MSLATPMNSGLSSNRVDIVVLGDGYTASETATFDAHVQALTDYLFVSGGALSDPFTRYASFFNVHVVHTASAESGTDDPAAGITRDTAFDTTYRYDGVTDRLLYGSNFKANAALNAALAGTEITADMKFMAVNSAKYGGGGGQYATFAGGNAQALEVALHEVGHSFAALADEYAYPGGAYAGAEPSRANVTADPTGAKWSHWLGYDQPGIGLIGAYEGGYYHDTGIYRPSESSKMRSLGQPFDAVAVEQFILRFHDFVDPLDSWTPATGLVTGLDFLTVTPVDADVIDIEWQVRGIEATFGDVTAFDLRALGLAPGSLIDVSARAFDNTDLVRIERDRLEMTLTWQAEIPDYVQVTQGTAQAEQLDGVAWKDKLKGQGGNDRLNGLDARDILLGGRGDDVLNGGNGPDRLTGGQGDDLLTGGKHRDVFDFRATGPSGNDTITDFQDGTDRLRFAPEITASDVTLSAVATGTLLTWATGTALLTGITPDQITPDDFF